MTQEGHNPKGWWIFIVLGLVVNLALPGRIANAGLFLIYTGFYDLFEKKLNKWIAMLLSLVIVGFYNYTINLLAGGV